MVASRTFNNEKLTFYTFLYSLCLFVLPIFAQECDISKCKGLIFYYEGIGCKPIYGKGDDCCPVSYDCSDLYKNRSLEKCYLRGKEYQAGEVLRDEDRPEICDNCTCTKNPDTGISDWSCAVFECNPIKLREGCWIHDDLVSCCTFKEVCPDDTKKVETCEFEGEIYREGETKYRHDRLCKCTKDDKGENVVMCKSRYCGVELRHSKEIRDNCLPIFFSWQKTPSIGHPILFHCHNGTAEVLRKASKETNNDISKITAIDKCYFNKEAVNIGDERMIVSDNFCIECVCEVPPVLTCRHHLTNECDYTKYYI